MHIDAGDSCNGTIFFTCQNAAIVFLGTSMGKIIFITGGARSGKSVFAEKLLFGKDDVLYVATAIGSDAEMKHRISMHQSRRNPRWKTIECYRGYGSALKDALPGRRHILLDCVTIMVSNLMLLDSGVDWDAAGMDAVGSAELGIKQEVLGFIALARGFAGDTIIVSNEVGMGVVPPNPLGRHFRDIAGKINILISDAADEVYLMASGIPVKIKG
jgi:adenosylcobinamide kinase/adenosylcobinamide-phosphate guanylyltransferase